MNQSSKDTSKSSSSVAPAPVVSSIITLGTGLAERGVSTSFDLMQEARSELKSATDATINYADTLGKTAIEFARTVAAHVDRMAASTIDQSRSAALDVVVAVRNTSHRTAALLAGTTADVVGGKDAPTA